jgi:23S rRNA (uracil1939-C5)-methyltransferase
MVTGRYVLIVNSKLNTNSKRHFPRSIKLGEPLTPRSPGLPCPHYPHCIGCPFIDVPYPEQLTRKREIVARCLEAYPSLAGLEVPPVIAAPHRLGYRARVKLVVRASGGDIATGLYVPETHRVMDISSCAVHPRPVNQVIGYLKRKCAELKIIPYDERVDAGELRYLDLRYSFAHREVSVTLVTRHREFPQGGPLARALTRKLSSVNGVMQNINEQRGNVIWGDRYRVLAGRDTLLEKVGSLALAFPAGVFSQANPASAKNLYDMVAEMAALTGQDTALDLYCGVGPISLTLARSARLVWGIDDSLISIDAAKQNARRNGVGNCRFHHGDVGEQISGAKSSLGRIDCVVVNPPRKGVQAATLSALAALGAQRIVYVSCEPLSLARDLDRLLHQGYRVSRLRPSDMFPQTDQVETVALLQR